MRAQDPPHVPGLLFGQRPAAHAELVESDPVGVQQPGHVMVGGHEQPRRVGEWRVVEQQPGVDVAVRGDDRQLPHRVVQVAGDRANPRFRG